MRVLGVSSTSPKIVYQEIQFHPRLCLGHGRARSETTRRFFIASADPVSAGRAQLTARVVAQLAIPAPHERRSVVARRLPHGIPAHCPAYRLRSRETEEAVGRLVEIAPSKQVTRRQILDWLR